MPVTASERGRAGRSAGAGYGRQIGWSVRLRLTFLYGGLFLLSGAALLGITYLLLAHSPVSQGVLVWYSRNGTAKAPDAEVRANLEHVVTQQHAAELETYLTRAGMTLGGMTVVSVALGWLMAGRALRPVRVMAERARRISERNLHERLAVTGAADEFKDLSDTFDGLLARLDTAFAAQRRFVANASHELRTPLTLQRAMIEVALSDPDADVRSLRAVCERVLVAGESQERLIEALLTLASSQRGLERREPLDLATVAGEAAESLHGRWSALRLETTLASATTRGDVRLVERLAANLVENALRYNVPRGWVRVSTGTDDGRPVLRVANSGPPVPHDRVPVLFQPFQRLGTRTGSPGDGHGLGLSIVAAVATAHGAEITTVPGAEGGLTVTVAFPSPDRR